MLYLSLVHNNLKDHRSYKMSDYITKIQKLFQTQELFQRRLSQLKMEESIDQNLTTQYNKCPHEIFKFLMNMRKLNRKYSSEIYNSSIFDYPSKIEQNLNIADKMYNFYDFNNPQNICENISKISTDL